MLSGFFITEVTVMYQSLFKALTTLELAGLSQGRSYSIGLIYQLKDCTLFMSFIYYTDFVHAVSLQW